MTLMITKPKSRPAVGWFLQPAKTAIARPIDADQCASILEGTKSPNVEQIAQTCALHALPRPLGHGAGRHSDLRFDLDRFHGRGKLDPRQWACNLHSIFPDVDDLRRHCSRRGGDESRRGRRTLTGRKAPRGCRNGVGRHAACTRNKRSCGREGRQPRGVQT